MSKPYLVLYHEGCRDGFAAAWAAWRALGEQADYMPMKYGDSIEGMDLAGRSIYLVDFSLDLKQTEALCAVAKAVTVIDHHVTAEWLGLLAVDQKLRFIYDENHSGCVLTWMFFFPGAALPPIFPYIEDWDLWRFDHPRTKAVCAGLDSIPREFMKWKTHYASIPDLVARGHGILDYKAQQIEAIASRPMFCKIGRFEVPCVNTMLLSSEVCEALYQRWPQRPFVAAFYFRHDGKVKWSLRSSQTGADVSEVARIYRGGGHKHAAGFEQAWDAEGAVHAGLRAGSLGLQAGGDGVREEADQAGKV